MLRRRVGLLVVDDEREQRLREEPRLEHASAVLVRDPALPSVPDRLDHRDSDVTRLFLDGVDHRLDPLPYDYRLHLRHPFTSDLVQQQHVTPNAVQLTDALAHADEPKAAAEMEPQARLVLGEDPRLQCPDASGLGLRDQRFEQRSPDAPPCAHEATYTLSSATPL